MDESPVPPPPSLTVHSAEPSPDHTLLTLSGDLDVATAGQFGDRLAEALAGGCRQLDVDLAAVGFCDVVAFNLLLAAGRTMRGRRGTLRILDACWSVERMAALFEVHDLLTLAPTETVTEAPGAGVGG